MDIRLLFGQTNLNVVSLPPAFTSQAAAPATVNYSGFAQQGLNVAQDLERFFLAVLGQARPAAPAYPSNPFPVFGQQSTALGAAAGFAVPRQGAYAAAFEGFAVGLGLGSNAYAQANSSAGFGQANLGFLAMFGWQGVTRGRDLPVATRLPLVGWSG